MYQLTLQIGFNCIKSGHDQVLVNTSVVHRPTEFEVFPPLAIGASSGTADPVIAQSDEKAFKGPGVGGIPQYL